MDSKEDIKTDVNELETKIIQQIEYYFSAINLSRDKFMKELLTKDEGWVPFATLLTFNRLKSLSDDKEVVINAMKKSDSNLMEISEDLDKIRRRLDKPLPEFNEEYTKELNERTIHLKGFPVDSKLDDIMNFCRQFGSVENIEMRRNFKSKQFKGCIFVVFTTKEDAQKVLNAEEVKYLDKELLRENKVNYFLRKKEFSERKNKKGFGNRKNSNSGDNTGADDKNGVKEESDVNPVKYENAVLKLREIDESTDYMDIKKVFLQHGKVAYVEAVNDKKESFVRFDDKDGATNALEKAKIVDENSDVIKVEISGKDVIAEVLTGEEEIQYWKNFEKSRLRSNEMRRDKKFQGRGGRKGKNMWNKGRKRGYKGSNDSENKKRVKTEDSD